MRNGGVTTEGDRDLDRDRTVNREEKALANCHAVIHEGGKIAKLAKDAENRHKVRCGAY